VSGLANGKAAGLDQLSSEQLKDSHKVLVCILTKQTYTKTEAYKLYSRVF